MENQEHPFLFEDGDMRVKAKHGERIITFKLSSHALCFASPVWKKFVFPPFPLLSSIRNEEEPNSKKACAVPEEPFPDTELDFTEDNPEALLILLQIAHLKFSDIPSQLPYEVLYHIATLCDQYDCRRLVKPWIQGWLEDEANEAYLPRQEGWLWIAYYFGKKEIFYQLMKILALRLTVDNDGKCMLMDEPFYRQHCTLETSLCSLGLDASPLPPEITDTIVNLRKDLNSFLLTSTTNNLRELFTGNVLSPCKELCSLAMYGLLSKYLSECKLWPLPRTENYKLTPFQLYTSIIRVLCKISSAHKPMAQLHIGSCSFTGAWKLELELEAKTGICKCDAHWDEGETDGSRFQEFMDHAVEEPRNFECPNNSLGEVQDRFIKEILELRPMEP